MSIETSSANKNFRKTLLLPTLLLGAFTGYSIPPFVGTLLVDMAATFKVPIGTASQLALIGSLTGLILGIAMSAISIRFKHKSLFLFGIAIFAVGSMIFFLAPNFATAIFSTFLTALGGNMMFIMLYTLIGEQLPLEKRGFAIGLVISSIMAAYVIVSSVSGVIGVISGWRSVLLWFIFPLSLVCLALSSLVIPSKQPQLPSTNGPSYAQAFKKILLNKSPIACVVSTLLIAFISVVPLYAVSFYRTVFSVSPIVGGFFSSIAASGGIVGGAAGGRLVNRFGRKPIAIVAVTISGISAILFTFMPFIGLSVALWAVSASAAAMTSASLASLTLEQVPEFRGSMMSINGTFDNLGAILGVIMGGLVLNLFSNNFHMLMVVLGAVGASAAAVLLFMARDPCRPT